PVTMTLQGLGAFSGVEEQSLGMLGMHGTYAANMAVNNCDLLIALGARFDDRVTGNPSTFAKHAYKIHVDIDPTAIDKNVTVDLPIVGDVKHVMAELASELNAPLEIGEWWEQINAWRDECPLVYEDNDGRLRTEYVVEKLFEKTKGNAVVVTDVGQHQMWTAQHFRFTQPRSLITSGGLGTMGFGVPAAIGASFAVKDRPVISINGDGGFQMNIQELVTAAAYKLPIKFVVINNSFLGMVRQWQELFHMEKYSFTDLSKSNPDFVKLGEAFGLKSFFVDAPKDLEGVLDKAFDYNEGPVLIECKVVHEDMVFPMIPPGASVEHMMVKRLNPKSMM
ncbi:MAG: thiamine pyrophosphate-binding protein, partial [Syntrophothermus sp.]